MLHPHALRELPVMQFINFYVIYKLLIVIKFPMSFGFSSFIHSHHLTHPALDELIKAKKVN